MFSAESQPRSLTDKQRHSLHSLLEKFAQSWAADQLPFWHQRLPAASHPLRRPALLGLIGIDLQRQWQHGRRPSVESYLQQYPELGPVEQAPVELIQAEWHARRQAGDPVQAAEFAQRFPQSWPRLRPELDGAAEAAVSRDEPVTRVFQPQPAAMAAQPPAGTAAENDEPATRAVAALPAAAIPERLGRYRIERPLGQGSLGTVYLAHDTDLERPVALKVLRPEAAADPAALERFTRAGRAAAALRHPCLCPVYEVSEDQGIHFVAMAYIDGKPVSLVLQEGPLWPPRQAAALVRKLAEALQTAHDLGVLHRDLTPANILIGPDGDPTITEFGLSRRQGDERLTRTGQVLGRAGYLAPEHLSGVPGAQGTGGDIYALGAVLYELLTGEPPLGRTLQQVLLQIMTQDPVPPSKQRPEVEPALDAICLKALARKPEERFRTMAELATALDGYLRDQAPASDRVAQAIMASSPAVSSKAGPPELPEVQPVIGKRSPSRQGRPIWVRRSLWWWIGAMLTGTLVVILGLGLIVLGVFSQNRQDRLTSAPVPLRANQDSPPDQPMPPAPVVARETPVVDYEREAARRVLDLGGTVRVAVADQNQELEISQPAELPNQSFQVTYINLKSTRVSDQDLVAFEGLGKLRLLDLSETTVTDEGLAHLRALKTIQHLDLFRTRMTGKGFVHLKGWTDLRSLECWGGGITDEGVQHLQGLTKLEHLGLCGSACTDEALAVLKSFSLRSLDLGRSMITDRGMPHLAGMKSLRALFVGDTEITDNGLVHLQGLENLERLGINGTRITGSGLKHFKGLTKLHDLGLSLSRITDDNLEQLQAVQSLRILNLDDTEVGDKGLEHLAKLTLLEMVQLVRTRVTDGGLKKFQTAVPGCRVVR